MFGVVQSGAPCGDSDAGSLLLSRKAAEKTVVRKNMLSKSGPY